MDISKFTGPRLYLRAEDLKGKPRQAIIEDCETVRFSDTTKPVLKLEGKTKQLVLNTTNTRTLMTQLTPETTCWPGSLIELRPDKYDFNDKSGETIVVSVLKPGPEVPDAPPDGDTQDDDDW